MGCKVIALAAFPFHYKKEDSSYQQLLPLDYNGFKQYEAMYTDKFQIPIYLMNDNQHMQALIDQIIEHFSDE